MESQAEIVSRLKKMANRMRKNVLDMALAVGGDSSHIGGGLSIIDITATLYGEIMKLDKLDPTWEGRDRFILSKGHGVLGYYPALAEVGFIDQAELADFEQDQGYLFGHPIMKRDKGIEFSNGSLGLGLSLGVGVALAGKRKNKDFKVFVLMGDGECNEGSVWEAAMAGAHHNLDNLIGIVDRNNLQQTGANSEIMDVGDLMVKWKSFGWNAIEIDGHDIKKLYDAFSKHSCSGAPVVYIAHTIKGKGFSFTENDNNWHHAPLSRTQYDLGIKELGI